jgi:ABC-2 type transport system ATP-binding protein
MAPVIVAEQLSKWYGPRLAVDRVSLEVEAGEVMGLLGPNGSGKTTILRILTGYLRPSGGTARVAGLDVIDDAFAVRGRVGYVPEDAPLYGGMGVREFLVFMAKLKGLAGGAATAAVDAAIERLALGDVRRRLIATLSRGYRQRVAIAQALLGDPDLLILDEPTNGLDPRQIIEVRGHIRALAGERTILITSHILSEIERVADRVAILLEGRLLGVQALRAAGPGHALRLRVRGQEGAVHACLAGVPGVRSVRAERDRETGVAVYRVEAGPEPVAEALAASLVRSGFGLADMGPAPVDLEALFLGLTGGRPEPPA